jgi:hypothetical protein
MAIETVTRQKVQPKTQTVPKVIPEVKKATKWPSIVVLVLVAFMFGYMALDYFVLNNKIENKIGVINKKYDSLEVMLSTKLPEITKAIQTEKAQVSNIKHLKPNK